MPNIRQSSSDRSGELQPIARVQFGLRGLFLFLFVSSIVCALWFRVLMPARESARQRECENKLQQIGLGLHGYHDVWGCFPAPHIADANGKPMTSWRTSLFPYTTQTSIPAWYDDRLPWNAPSNFTPASRMSACFNLFRCSSASGQQAPTSANYVMIVDPAASNKQWKTLGKLKNAATTIVVAEIADSDIFWTEPRDLSMDEMSSRINDKAQASISSHHTYGALVLFADGSVRLLDERTTPAELRTMLSVGDSSP